MIPLERSILQKIKPGLYDYLIAIGFTHYFDKERFARQVHAFSNEIDEPAVSSVFCNPRVGGSYDGKYRHRRYWVTNGCVDAIDGFGPLIDESVKYDTFKRKGKFTTEERASPLPWVSPESIDYRKVVVTSAKI